MKTHKAVVAHASAAISVCICVCIREPFGLEMKLTTEEKNRRPQCCEAAIIAISRRDMLLDVLGYLNPLFCGVDVGIKVVRLGKSLYLVLLARECLGEVVDVLDARPAIAFGNIEFVREAELGLFTLTGDNVGYVLHRVHAIERPVWGGVDYFVPALGWTVVGFVEIYHFQAVDFHFFEF